MKVVYYNCSIIFIYYSFTLLILYIFVVIIFHLFIEILLYCLILFLPYIFNRLETLGIRSLKEATYISDVFPHEFIEEEAKYNSKDTLKLNSILKQLPR